MRGIFDPLGIIEGIGRDLDRISDLVAAPSNPGHNPNPSPEYVWSDEYTGDRHTYYSPLRPIRPTMLPEGYVAVLTMGQDERIVVTTKPLPERYIKQLSLETR